MLVAASWIALNTVDLPRSPLFVASLTSVLLGGGSTLVLITQGVLGVDPWYQPSIIIPLAGMIFAASMTNISLALERLYAELQNGVDFDKARDTAFRTSMIPVINSFLAVGLISLPGMMTGQILSGVSPLIAVRYQIMVMCMIFGAAGLSTVCFLVMVRKTEHFRSYS
jgi:putative ABC transport system permease protein